MTPRNLREEKYAVHRRFPFMQSKNASDTLDFVRLEAPISANLHSGTAPED